MLELFDRNRKRIAVLENAYGIRERFPICRFPCRQGMQRLRWCGRTTLSAMIMGTITG